MLLPLVSTTLKCFCCSLCPWWNVLYVQPITRDCTLGQQYFWHHFLKSFNDEANSNWIQIDEASYWTGQCAFICFSLFASYLYICITSLVLSKSCLSVVCPWKRVITRNIGCSVSKILFPFLNIVFCYNLVFPLEWW